MANRISGINMAQKDVRFIICTPLTDTMGRHIVSVKEVIRRAKRWSASQVETTEWDGNGPHKFCYCHGEAGRQERGEGREWRQRECATAVELNQPAREWRIEVNFLWLITSSPAVWGPPRQYRRWMTFDNMDTTHGSEQPSYFHGW